MLKFMGLALVIIFCSLIGITMSMKLSDKVRLLECCTAFISGLMDELRFTLAPVEDLLASLCRREEFARLDFISEALADCKKGVPFPDAFRQAVEGSKLDFDTEEREILGSLAQVIGAMDLDAQLHELTHHRYLLEEKRTQAKQKKASHGGIYKTLGVLSGFALAIILV